VVSRRANKGARERREFFSFLFPRNNVLAAVIHQGLGQHLQMFSIVPASSLHEGANGAILPAGMRLSNTGNLGVVVDPAIVGDFVDVAGQLSGDFGSTLAALGASAAVNAEGGGGMRGCEDGEEGELGLHFEVDVF
jgi:hypothetical protein